VAVNRDFIPVGISADTSDSRTLKLHFSNPVNGATRASLLAALNLPTPQTGPAPKTAVVPREAIDRAGRLINAMAAYIGRMALDADQLDELNEHWLFMEELARGDNARTSRAGSK